MSEEKSKTKSRPIGRLLVPVFLSYILSVLSYRASVLYFDWEINLTAISAIAIIFIGVALAHAFKQKYGCWPEQRNLRNLSVAATGLFLLSYFLVGFFENLIVGNVFDPDFLTAVERFSGVFFTKKVLIAFFGPVIFIWLCNLLGMGLIIHWVISKFHWLPARKNRLSGIMAD